MLRYSPLWEKTVYAKVSCDTCLSATPNSRRIRSPRRNRGPDPAGADTDPAVAKCSRLLLLLQMTGPTKQPISCVRARANGVCAVLDLLDRGLSLKYGSKGSPKYAAHVGPPSTAQRIFVAIFGIRVTNVQAQLKVNKQGPWAAVGVVYSLSLFGA